MGRDVSNMIEIVKPEPIVHAPGIYFGMSDAEYFADQALGSTVIKELVLDPIEYQHDRLYKEEKEDTWALKWGHAIHCRVLEGKPSLDARFPVMPAKEDYEGLLDTMDDLRKHCADLGIKAGKTKGETIIRIKEFDTKTPIWEEITALFDKSLEGRTALPKKAFKEIEQAAAWMQRDKYLAPVMENGTITAGASEVSIFYEDNGVRLKARIDHLLSHAVIDLKSFRPFFKERVERAAVKAIERQRYDIQCAAYIRALRAAADLYANDQVFNNPYGDEFLAAVFDALGKGEMKWIWVLIKASGAPQPVVREFNLESMTFRNAQRDVEGAIQDYRRLRAEFGLDNDWVPDLPVEILSDEDFSPYAFM